MIGVEQYQPRVLRSTVNRGPRTRQLTSEIFFTPIGDPPAFMTIRSTERVDGPAVPGAHERVVQALSEGSAASRLELLTTLAAEGARHNLGVVGRTFNDPTLTLMLLGPELR